MDVFHQDIATATNVIVKRRSLQQSEHWDFSGRFLFCKIIYSCTESHHIVLEKQRGVQFIPRSQPKNYASVVFRRSQYVTQVWTKGSSCVKQVESDVYRYWSAVGNKEVKGLWRLKVSTKHTKRKAAHYINTLDDVYIKMVKSFQKKKEEKNWNPYSRMNYRQILLHKLFDPASVS